MADKIKHLDEVNFQEMIQAGVTFVDFYADWCGPCHMMNPILEELADSMDGKATIAKVNVDEAQGVASTYGVTSIPTMILFKNGEEKKRLVGVNDKEALERVINEAL